MSARIGLAALLLACVAWGQTWQAESIKAIQNRMAQAESAVAARRADSIQRTRVFDHLELGDTIEFRGHAGIVVVKSNQSVRDTTADCVGMSYGLAPAGRCIAVRIYLDYSYPSFSGGGWSYGDGFYVIWRDEVERLGLVKPEKPQTPQVDRRNWRGL